MTTATISEKLAKRFTEEQIETLIREKLRTFNPLASSSNEFTQTQGCSCAVLVSGGDCQLGTSTNTPAGLVGITLGDQQFHVLW